MTLKIIHDFRYFEDYLNGPDTFVLFETFDLQFLTQLLADESLRINKSDKRVIRRLIKKYSSGPDDLGVKTIAVEYYKTKNSGKYIGRDSIHGLENSVKEIIHKYEGFLGLDLVNRVYTIVHEVAKLNGVSLPAVKYFLENRDAIFTDHLGQFGTIKEVKYYFCKILQNPVNIEVESDFAKELLDESIAIQELFKHPDYPEFTFTKIIEMYTTHILKRVSDYLTINGIIEAKYYSLNGDCIYFKPLKSFSVKDIEDYVLRETQLTIKLH